MSNIKEIALRANVSIATVSKALNNKGGVNADTYERIMRIADELGYRPNLFARSLKRGSSMTIGIIAEDLTVFNTPDIVDGIDTVCEEAGYHYILGNLRYNKRYGNGAVDMRELASLTDSAVDTMLSKQVDGIVYIGSHCHEIKTIKPELELPVVFAYCSVADDTRPYVMYDDRKAAYDLTRLLLSKGHKCIGVIAGQPDSIHTARRLTGYQEALYEAGIPYNPNLTLYGNWERDAAHAVSAPLLDAGVSAIFAQNDLMAMGVMDCCADNGIAVGRELALIGFDNREISTVCRPTLSTVALPLFEIGRRCADILFELIGGTRDESENMCELLPCTIIERESTGGPRGEKA